MRVYVLALAVFLAGCITVTETPSSIDTEDVSNMPGSPVQAPEILEQQIARTTVGHRRVARVQVMVGADGHAGDRFLIRSTENREQDDAALLVLDNWLFEPARDADNQPVPMQMVVPVVVE